MGRLPLPLGTAGEMKVKKVRGVWVARCWHRRDDGTYADVRRRRRTKEVAKQAVRDAIKDLMPPSRGAELAATSLFSEAVELWLKQYREDAENGIYSLTSVDTYTDHYRNHVKKPLGNLRIFEVTTPVINRLCQNKLKNHSLALAKHTKAVIGNTMTFVVQLGVLENNPVKEIAPLTERRAKTKRKKPQALTRDQVQDFLIKLDSDEEAGRRDLPDLSRFFIATGERLGEALGTNWSDFDEDAEALVMSGNIVQARGKGTVRNLGKSEASEGRTIQLPGWCVRMLRERRSKLGVVDLDQPIFPNSRGGYLNASNLTNRHWVPFRKRAGYEWVTFHTFRKTVATLLDESGLTARQIADLLGHANPWTTYNSYMGRGQASRASADALDTLIHPDA